MNTIEQAAPARKVSILLGIGIALCPLIFAWFTLRKGHTQRARAIAFGYLVLLTIWSFNRAPTPKTPTPEPTVAEAPLEQVDAYKVSQDYEANEVSAEMKYKGKKFRVVGDVVDISTSITGGIRIRLRSPNEFLAATMEFPASEYNKDFFANKVSKGTQITVTCTNKGSVIKSVQWDCI